MCGKYRSQFLSLNKKKVNATFYVTNFKHTQSLLHTILTLFLAEWSHKKTKAFLNTGSDTNPFSGGSFIFLLPSPDTLGMLGGLLLSWLLDGDADLRRTDVVL